jgi:hypothetical protein
MRTNYAHIDTTRDSHIARAILEKQVAQITAARTLTNLSLINSMSSDHDKQAIVSPLAGLVSDDAWH